MKTMALCVLSVLLCGCASGSYSTGTAKLSRELVERSLVRGKTTKSDVRALLGEPQSTVSGTFGQFAVESWSYTKTFHRDTADKGGLGGSFARYAVTGSLYDRVEVSILTVSFDANGRVSGHTFATSAAGAPR